MQVEPHVPGQAQAAIALGSNLGDPHAILDAALKTIAYSPDITLDTQSHYYQTAAVGPPQPDYLNACALLTTRLTPAALLQRLLEIEIQFGRVRQERWGPRLLDLDLLLVDSVICDQPGLQLPHPRMTQRAFVLVPLAEIAPHWIEPISGKAIADLVQTVDCSGIRKPL